MSGAMEHEPFNLNGENSGEDGDGSAPKKATKQSRKRTKTGCLTCRKRRIKCGEEKPTCLNCKKSKRQCEGYHQRVIFKDPVSSFQGAASGGSTRVISNSETKDTPFRNVSHNYISENIQSSTPGQLPDIVPKISAPSGAVNPDISMQVPPTAHLGPGITDQQAQSLYGDQNPIYKNSTETFQQAFPRPSETNGTWNNYTHSGQNDQLHTTEYPTTGTADSSIQNWVLYPEASPDSLHGPAIVPQPIDIGYVPTLLQEDEEEPYDVSDEEIYMGEEVIPETTEDDHLKRNDLGILVALQAQQDIQDLSMRSFTSFIDRPNMLAMYQPSARHSPLQDPMTARIFCHFINVTGPSISMYERHPANPSLIFQGRPVSKSQQHLWTYTLPTLALQDQALLHAMLATASLHIAKLQNSPIASSLKHCAIAIRRIAKNVSNPSRIGNPATLAATLLIGYYECWCADHQKWCNHLLGARQLLKHIDFAGMTTYVRSLRAKRRQAAVSPDLYDGDDFEHNFIEDDIDEYDEVDEKIVGLLMGKSLRYDQYGRIIDGTYSGDTISKIFSPKELENYDTLKDLFWWYCRQDVYQSLLSGGRLFMEYDYWSHCPPRAPLGRLSATYGTFDHLILLLARVADFASRDLKRKREAVKRNGGQWRPPATMQMPGQSGPPRPPPPNSSAQFPQFPGMFPPTPDPTLPMGFVPADIPSPEDSTGEERDLDMRTKEAEEEWSEILAAFSIIQDQFGSDFQALGPEYCVPIQSPFGTALQFRTYSIAGIWMNYYMGLICLHRAHPSMPPAGIIAAGVAARQTAFFANQIGRITAGVAPESLTAVHVNPGVGAGLIELTFCLFVAGVQYQDAEQRAWLVDKAHSVARLTGWQSGVAVADGCEAYWFRAAELGRGPPYTKRHDLRMEKEILNPIRVFPRVGPDSNQPGPRVKTDERVHYALGILSLQEDIERLDLD